MGNFLQNISKAAFAAFLFNGLEMMLRSFL